MLRSNFLEGLGSKDSSLRRLARSKRVLECFGVAAAIVDANLTSSKPQSGCYARHRGKTSLTFSPEAAILFWDARGEKSRARKSWAKYAEIKRYIRETTLAIDLTHL